MPFTLSRRTSNAPCPILAISSRRKGGKPQTQPTAAASLPQSAAHPHPVHTRSAQILWSEAPSLEAPRLLSSSSLYPPPAPPAIRAAQSPPSPAQSESA